MSLVSRLLSPVGFGLVLVCFLLPFTAVSCSTPAGTVEASYTGLDLITDTAVTATTSGTFRTDDGPYVSALTGSVAAGVQAWAIAAVAVIVLGLLSSALPGSQARRLVTSSLALAGAVVLALTQGAAQAHLTDAIYRGQESFTSGLTRDQVEDLAGARIGYWLAFLGLAALAVSPLVGELARRRAVRTAEAEAAARARYGPSRDGTTR